MPERVDKTILSFEPDMSSARKSQQAVSNISKEYERLKQRAGELQEQFRTQGQAAVYVTAQIAQLEEAYRRGEISQQAYIIRSQALSAEQQALDSAFASTVQNLSQADNSIKDYIKSMAAAKDSTRDTAQAVADVKEEITAAAAAMDATAAATQRMREAGRGAAVYRYFGTDISALGRTAAMAGVPMAGELSGMAYTGVSAIRAIERLPSAFELVAEKIGLTTMQFGAVAAGAGVFAAGLLLLKDAMDKSKRAAEEFRKELEQRAVAEEQRRAIIMESTTEEIQSLIERTELNKQLALENIRNYEQQIAIAETLKETHNRILSGLSSKTERIEFKNLFPIEIGKEVIENVDELDAALKGWGSRVDENQAAIENADRALEQYSGALDSGALAVNDARVAEERLAEIRRASSAVIVADIQRQATFEQDVRRKAATYSVEQVKQEMEELGNALLTGEEQIKNLQAALRDGTITAEDYNEQFLAVNGEMRQAERMLDALRTVIMRFAQAHEDAADIERSRKEAAQDFTRAAQDALAIEQRRTALVEQYAEREEQTAYRRQIDDVREAEDVARRQAKARASLNEQLIDLDLRMLQDRDRILEKMGEAASDHDDATLKALNDYQKKEKRATANYWRDMARINRDERRTVLEAAAGLDARAVWQAQRAAADQRKARTEQFEQEKAERAEDYEERLRELEQQRDAKKQAAAKELRDLDEKHRKERAARITAFNRQMAEEAQERAIRRRRMQEDREYEDALRFGQFQNELSAINQLSSAADALLARTRAVAEAAGAVGTTAYGDVLGATTGRYIMYQGKKVRLDMYDPNQAAGMTASEWYLWKLQNGYRRGGYTGDGPKNEAAGVVHNREYVVPENGALVLRSPEQDRALTRIGDFLKDMNAWKPVLELPREWKRKPTTPLAWTPYLMQRPEQYPTYSAQSPMARGMGNITINVTEAFNAERTAQAVRRELMSVLTA